MSTKCLARSMSSLSALFADSLFLFATRRSLSSTALRKASETSASTIDDPNNTSLFSYTSGRYLFNERLRLKERHVKFNVEALKRAAETCVGNRHGKVVEVRKLAEGGFNRVLILQLEDGFELIAKIPYHIARPKYFATASEVATMTFLRSKGIPVPEVYSYSAGVENPVGTEYILMQRAPGVCVALKWADLQDVEIRRLAHSFVELEKKLFEFPFSATGSLYFKKDISADLQAPLYTDGPVAEMEQFCIGPIADYTFWYGRRAGLKLNRGPWRNPVEYLRSIANKEIEWTQRYGKSMEPDFPHNALGLGVQHPEDYLKLLESYKLVTPHILPKDPTSTFKQPTLRHPDLTHSNIFVESETGRISCLIDWQHTIIQPQLLAASYPEAFENPDSELSLEIASPQLPEDFDSLSEEEQANERELYRRRLLFYTYRVANGGLNKLHFAALQDRVLEYRRLLVDRAGRQWDGNLVTLKLNLILMVKLWKYLADVEGIECPVHFDEGELDKFEEIEENWASSNLVVEQIWRPRVCNMSEEGRVENEDYEEARKKLEELKAEVAKEWCEDAADLEKLQTGWPFRDREEVK